MSAPTSGISGGTLTTGLAIVTAIGGIITGILAWIRNKKTDKLALYSQFVDDLHDEVTRLRTQYEEDQTKYQADRKGWSEREAELTREIELLKGQTRKLERELATVKGRMSRSATVRKEAGERTIASLEAELSRVYGELELLRSSVPLDQKRAARSVLVETFRQLGMDPPYIDLPSEPKEGPDDEEG